MAPTSASRSSIPTAALVAERRVADAADARRDRRRASPTRCATLAPRRPDARALGIGAAGHDRPRRRRSTTRPTSPRSSTHRCGRALEDALGIPVVVDNDANVAVVAELAHGAARGCTEVLLITLGTGVGGGIVTRRRGAARRARLRGRGRALPGRSRTARCARAVSAGHWEALASGTALGALGRERAAAGAAPSVLARAGGVVDAITGVLRRRRRAGRRRRRDRDRARSTRGSVAIGLVGLVNILDPERGRGLGRPGRARRRAARAVARRVRRPHRRRRAPSRGADRPRRARRAGRASSAPRCWRGSSTRDPVKLGLTLPSFRDDVDHVARGRGRRRRRAGSTACSPTTICSGATRDGSRRPALEMFALMGAVAAATRAHRGRARSSRARRCDRRRCWRTASTRWRASSGPSD